jgi:FAD/FMN-containing dehydrogenase
MKVRQICAVLSLACIVSASWLAKAPAGVGELVARAEVERAMGACGEYGGPVTVCYGGSCLSGGCGCARIQSIVNGTVTIDPAVACGTASCTAPQSVGTALCSG